jgi:hypothetical protein
MTATKGSTKKKGSWLDDWLPGFGGTGTKSGSGKKGGSGKGKKGDDHIDQLIGLAVVAGLVYFGVTYAIQTVTAWWIESFLPWFEEWRFVFSVATAALVGLAVLAVVLWVRAGWRRRIARRAETRQPVTRGGEKPTVKVETDKATRKATKAIVTFPDGVHPGPREVEQLADIHGRDLFGGVADVERHDNAKTGRTQVVLTPPVADDTRDPVERDLHAIVAQELPQVTQVRVMARDAEGRPVRVELAYEATSKLLTSPAAAGNIEKAMAGKLGWTDPSKYRMTWNHGDNVAVLEQCDMALPEVEPFPFGRITDILDRSTRVLPYGVAANGELQTWDLDRRPHSLVSGETGSGKSYALGVLITMALLMGWRVIILDPKKRTFRHLDGFPNVERYGDARGFDSQRELADVITAIHALMEDRNDLDDAALAKQQRVLVVVDELHELWAGLNRLWREDLDDDGKPLNRKGDHPCIGLLEEIGTLAREVMIHLCFAIQRPDAKVAGGLLRAQLGNRISLGPMGPEGARMMFGAGQWVRAAQEVPAIKGRCLAPLPGGVIGYQLAQTWWLDLKHPETVKQVRKLVEAEHRGLVTVPLVARRAGVQPAPDDETTETAAAPLPVKKAVAKRAPTKKAATAQAGGSDEPEVLGWDDPPACHLKRGDWTVIVDEDGSKRNVRISTNPVVDDEAGTVTIGGFGWKRTVDASEPVRRLHVDGE